MSGKFNWSSDVFADIYNTLKFETNIDLDTIDFTNIKNDLANVLITPLPSDQSRSKLGDASKPVALPCGDEVKLNQASIEITGVLSNELDLDELNTAELLYNASDLSYKKGTSIGDSARLAYYLRAHYILNIVGFLVSQKRLDIITNDHQVLFDNVLKSFSRIYTLSGKLNDMIDKQKVTGDINSLAFINCINYSRSQLFNAHELLGQVVFGLVDNYYESFGTLSNYKSLVEFISKNISDEDIFVIHFLPLTLQLFKKLLQLGDETSVDQFYKTITSSISKDYETNNFSKSEDIDLSKSKLSGFEIVTSFIFLTEFIPWCKQSSSRTAKYDFKDDILKYMELLISYGVMERLLSYCSETSNVKTQQAYDWSNMYDFRALLQKNFPRLTPAKFHYPGSQELSSVVRPGYENVSKLVDISFLTLDPSLNETLVSPFFQSFFSVFISNAAVVMTSLRDSEEDFVLSALNASDEEEEEEKEESDNEEDSTTPRDKEKLSGLDLDKIAQRAELERFYLAFAYTYNNRSELCALFWGDERVTNDIIGFISWGLANNTSPLITATFCMLLGTLASAGGDASSRIWEILVHNNNNTGMKKNDFSKISVDSLYDSLKYYIDSLNESFEQDLNDQLMLSQKKQDFLFSATTSKQDLDDSGENRIVIELAEDSLVFISGFIQLLSAIVKNLNTKNERSKEIKSVIYARFSPIIKGFLKFDNLINGSRFLQVDANIQSSNNPKFIDLPNVYVSDDSRIILTNLILTFLGDFVDNDSDPYIRYEIWRLVDRWMYQGLYSLAEDKKDDAFRHIKRKYISKKNVPVNQAFTTNLTHLSQIGNFAVLVKKLLTPFEDSNEAFTKYSLLYPCDLGLGYRFNNQLGIWPYIEFLMQNVFANSSTIASKRDRFNLQVNLLELFSNALDEIDWKFLIDVAPKIIRDLKNFNGVFDSLIPGVQLDFEVFVKLHHSVAVMNYLFESKTFTALFGLVNIGVDSINESSESAELVSRSLCVINSLLKVQNSFINKLLPILRNKDTQQQLHRGTTIGIGTSMSLALATPRTIFDCIYYPKNLGTHGVADFYEVILFHLPAVVQFALYVSCENPISTKALSILKGVSQSKFFVTTVSSSADPLLNNDRLITTFENIDESIKIKFAFIDKFEELEDSLNMKYEILDFILGNLDQFDGKAATIAHFLLGYKVKGDTLELVQSNDQITLLKSFLNTLSISLDLISEIDYNNGNNHIIDVGPAKLSSMILQILIKLCQDPISSSITLNQLREYEQLFEKLVNCQPKLDLNTVWCGNQFNGDLQIDASNVFVDNQPSTQAFFSFISQRNLILQYLSLEFHSVKSRTKREYYSKVLTNDKEFVNRTPKVLTFLNILNYSFKNFEVQKYEWLDRKFNMSLILEEVNAQKNGTLDFSVLTKAFRLLCQTSNLITPESKQLFAEEIMVEGSKISDFVTKYSVSTDLKDVQLKCLHSWCQLIEILVTDSGINSSNFILEVLQVIIPKINDYFDVDISFSEEMVSLCVLLFDLYDQSTLTNRKGEEFALGIERLIPLFQTCIAGILNSNSTPGLRSDLYVVGNKFLLKCFERESFLKQMMLIIKSVDKKFFQVICNDAIYSEGPSRITSTLFLESLVHLGTLVKVDFILNAVIKNNALSLLVRSVKRTDAMIKLCQEKNSGVTLEHFVFDLMAFKATLYFFARVAKSKNGALQLIQNELFSILNSSKFLQIDPDIGLSLQIEEVQDHKTVNVNVLLDTPLSITDLVDPYKLRNENNISYFEFLVPIFQLLTTVLLSMGPNYQPAIIQTKELMKSVNRLVVGVMKRDFLVETKQIGKGLYKEESHELASLKELVKLFILIDSLANYSV
ncbi:nuclear pore protein, putative [Candida dubliniensis CD36]|uniref:Nucleoporin, putative n=1 Tax=Candida dubliniensis (strain CD36 / ATCC MYA-646 / CBS 7987 / NCPF 3949 / NRRL Y-17841) TaxID=573826 RepID=B9WKL8_CANDC|nr:nuclear pore protein, putative [Candida dubliniensis CD36]CAX39566.1 nuclear pore protein, putative [Candida dubliniensis CD36]